MPELIEAELETLTVTVAERDMILAALRAYQAIHDQTAGDVPDDLHDIATNAGAHEALDLEAIDALFERINC